MATVRLYAAPGKRDVRIDWLRGLAMTCVIVNHSRLPSLLSWFSYERLWVVTAAEVFVVLSGIVLGMVYGRRLSRDGWQAVVHGLGRRALLLYVVFVGVTVSVLAMAAMGIDVQSLTSSRTPAWFLAPQTMTWTAWRDVLLMRTGPWAFEIIGMYVWLVAAAVPCLLVLHYGSWRALLAVSWALYLSYRIAPHPLTAAGFESAFPLLAWQLIFVHGLAIGYHREAITQFVGRMPKPTPRVAMLVTAGFTLFAFSNPWTEGPAWLHLRIVSPEWFSQMYERFFALRDLGAGRLLNLAIALPVGYMLLTRYAAVMRPFERLFVTLGQQSLGAFVLQVYGLVVLAHLPLPDSILINTLTQIALILAIATILDGAHVLQDLRRRPVPARAQPMAA